MFEYSATANRWLEFVSQTVGGAITFGAALFAVTSGGAIHPGEVGMILTNATMITYALPNLVRAVTSVETNVVAIERIDEYTHAPEEEIWNTSENIQLSMEWPEEGEITFSQYSTRYREHLDLALNTIDLSISGGEKLGVIGRTGAGKSTLVSALFRLIESSSGSISIDQKDISEIGLHDLRNKISIITQDPFMFTGSIRSNLDPLNMHTDDVIWYALKSAHIYDYVRSLEGGISYMINQGGDNLSLGQKQLLCLARALLEKNRIVVLDEPTASVDIETDELIHDAIKKEFRHSTVITIAHRINTIIEYDRIMVLEKGKVAEFGTVFELFENQEGIFHSMIQTAYKGKELPRSLRTTQNTHL